MKKLLIAAAMTLSLGAAADDKADTCDLVNKLAHSIMDARQRGVDMAEAMRLANESSISDLIKPIIIAAYEKPRYSVEENQRNAVTDFKNAVYLVCVKSI